MSENIVNDYCATLISTFQNVVKEYERSIEIIKETEDELNDLNHEVEFADNRDLYGGWFLYKEIREARRKRRAAKEQAELLRDMYEYIKSQPGQTVKTKMQQLQGASVKVFEAQHRRMYAPRQRTDLTITDKTYDAHRPFEELLQNFNQTKITNKHGKPRK